MEILVRPVKQVLHLKVVNVSLVHLENIYQEQLVNVNFNLLYFFSYVSACSSHCTKCVNNLICQECESGYGLENDKCITCPSRTYLAGTTCEGW